VADLDCCGSVGPQLDCRQDNFGRGWPVDIASRRTCFRGLIFELSDPCIGPIARNPKIAVACARCTGLLNVAGFNICAVFAQLNAHLACGIVSFTMPVWSSRLAWSWLGERSDHIRALSLAVGRAPVLPSYRSPFSQQFKAELCRWVSSSRSAQRSPGRLPRCT
jgi:hypothetical protein